MPDHRNPALTQTLEVLEDDIWPDPEGDERTFLIRRIHELRRTPLGAMTVEDLRIQIGQEASLVSLMPLAIEVLEGEPFAEGDFFPGDLLYAVLRVGAEHWRVHVDQGRRIDAILEELPEPTAELREEVPDVVLEQIASWKARPR